LALASACYDSELVGVVQPVVSGAQADGSVGAAEPGTCPDLDAHDKLVETIGRLDYALNSAKMESCQLPATLADAMDDWRALLPAMGTKGSMTTDLLCAANPKLWWAEPGPPQKFVLCKQPCATLLEIFKCWRDADPCNRATVGDEDAGVPDPFCVLRVISGP
jgi:hypothetical protein